jgi:hypothetical protein
VSTRSTAIQGTREYVKAYADPGGTALTDAQVIEGYKAGRQALPYTAVYLMSGASKVGRDEEIVDENGGSPRKRIEGLRRGRVEIHGFGEGSEEWLENLVSSLANEDAHRLNTDNGVTLVYLSPVITVNRMRNANLEEHFVLPLTVTFRVVGPWLPVTVLAAAEVDYEASLAPAGSATLSLDIDVNLP